MDELEIKQKLDKLADWKSGIDVLNLEKQAVIDTILTPEIKEKLKEIDAEFESRSASAKEAIAELEAEVRKMILDHGASVRGNQLHAVWSPGRITWDHKSLDGYALGHPEILFMRKEGEPSVALKRIG